MKIHIDARNKIVAINVQEDTHLLFETIEIDTIDVDKFKNTQVYECYYNKETKSIIYDFVARSQKLWDLWQYDKSIAVNGFTIMGIEMWLTKEDRTFLYRLATAKYNAKEALMQLTLPNGDTFDFPPKNVLDILDAIERYAGDCKQVTTREEIKIRQLKTNEEIINYDFTKNYPPKLAF